MCWGFILDMKLPTFVCGNEATCFQCSSFALWHKRIRNELYPDNTWQKNMFRVLLYCGLFIRFVDKRETILPVESFKLSARTESHFSYADTHTDARAAMIKLGTYSSCVNSTSDLRG